ncbi:DegV family protein [Pseudoflavonifractor capillosus]|uniref:DegV family protein n=1 Tax=Pseudoflavonifractor capillosus TaxID=106588 RepID=UPI001955FB80|nr:DegV family protein [Pseudoflavonifractor capillosus]MBM6897054.1 DegV family protein [Pseudoflavonifractor capillosus]
MKARVAVVTDSNSGITVEEGKKLGIFVVPMPINIDGKVYFEGLNLSQEYFYQRLTAGAEMFTSQPSPADTLELWNRILKGYDQLVYIPMSAGLSSTYATARMMAEDYQGKVQVVDNRRISVTQRQSVMDALSLADQGQDAAQIRRTLEEQASDASIFLMVDTLKYLRRGGRVSGIEAFAGTMLNIKPVLTIAGEKLESVGKARGAKAARLLMLDKLKEDLEGRLKPLHDSGQLAVKIACSQVPDQLREEWKAQVQGYFHLDYDVEDADLTLSVACHTGPGVLGVGAVRI